MRVVAVLALALSASAQVNWPAAGSAAVNVQYFNPATGANVRAPVDVKTPFQDAIQPPFQVPFATANTFLLNRGVSLATPGSAANVVGVAPKNTLGTPAWQLLVEKTRDDQLLEASKSTPKARVNFNLLSKFEADLYAHAQVMIDRVKALEGGISFMADPSTILPPISVPAGFALTPMDGLYTKLFFYIGRCDSDWVQFALNLMLPAELAEWGIAPYDKDICHNRNAIEWIWEEWDSYVEDETTRLYAYLRENPTSLQAEGYAPSIASSFFPNFNAARIQAMRALPRATYRMWPYVLQEALRVFDNAGPFSDIDARVNLTPFARDFGFPPNFEVKGLESLIQRLVFRLQFCRAESRYILTQGKYDIATSNWAVPPTYDYEWCMDFHVKDWYEDEFNDWARDDTVEEFGAWVQREAEPAAPIRPVPVSAVPGQNPVTGQAELLVGYSPSIFTGP